MASSTISTIYISSVSTYSSQTSLGSKSRPSALSFNTPKSFRGFNGLKVASAVNLESDTTFLVKESNTALWASTVPKAQQRERKGNQPQPHASYKVVVLGAAGGIGQPLGLLIKMFPLVSALHLYDAARSRPEKEENETEDVAAPHPRRTRRET